MCFLLIYTTGLVVYSGKLSRENTFTKFMILEPCRLYGVQAYTGSPRSCKKQRTHLAAGIHVACSLCPSLGVASIILCCMQPPEGAWSLRPHLLSAHLHAHGASCCVRCLVSQDIWHPRKFGTPNPNILENGAPTRTFGTPNMQFRGTSVH